MCQSVSDVINLVLVSREMCESSVNFLELWNGLEGLDFFFTLRLTPGARLPVLGPFHTGVVPTVQH